MPQKEAGIIETALLTFEQRNFAQAIQIQTTALHAQEHILRLKQVLSEENTSFTNLAHDKQESVLFMLNYMLK